MRKKRRKRRRNTGTGTRIQIYTERERVMIFTIYKEALNHIKGDICSWLELCKSLGVMLIFSCLLMPLVDSLLCTHRYLHVYI